MEKNKNQYKSISREDLFNMLQDQRHVLIIDFREKQDFEKSFIRNSINCDPKSEQTLMLVKKKIDDEEHASTIYEQKSGSSKIRRLVVIGVKELIGQLDQNGFDKYYNLKQDYQNFEQKYPFLCISAEINQNQKDGSILTIGQDKLLFAFCKFPTEIITDFLFIGDVFNSNNKRQLEDLKIKSLIDCMYYDENEKSKVLEFKLQQFNYINVGINLKQPAGMEVQIDFDEINKHIDSIQQNKESPILVYCQNGDDVSPAIAIAYLIYSKKMNVNMASMIVFQKRSCVKICKWIYTQLLSYIPNQTNNN